MQRDHRHATPVRIVGADGLRSGETGDEQRRGKNAARCEARKYGTLLTLTTPMVAEGDARPLHGTIALLREGGVTVR